MSERPIVDPRLAEWGEATKRQSEYLKAINKYRGVSQAARALSVTRTAVQQAMQLLREKAAANGHAPGHWESGAPAGYIYGKVTEHVKDGEVVQYWPRLHPKGQHIAEQLKQFVEGLKDEVPEALPVFEVPVINEDLCTSYHITDYHFGMLALAQDSDGQGADYNLDIAEELLVRLITDLVSRSPASGTAILFLMGDLIHFDGPDPVTPTHRHPLDAAARQRTVVRVTSRALKRVVRILLSKHAKVQIVAVEGNHDLAATPFIRQILLDHYESEPRVDVADCDLPYQAVEFGATLIGVSHGHKRKKESLPALFCAMFREAWGRTKTCIIHTGHYHSAEEKDYPGCKVIQHRTAAAPDSHALRGGWFSEREMQAFLYHFKWGPQGRYSVTPEMVGM